MNRIIAVDFDGTLCHGNWPGVGESNRKLIDKLLKLQREGNKIPLFPARGKQGNPSLSPAYFRTSRKTAVKPPIFRVCGQIQRVFSKPPDAELLRATVSAVARNTAPMLP